MPTKTRKIGTRTWTLSLTPRRFRTISTPSTTNLKKNRLWLQVSGRMLKIWSTPAATDVEMVRT